MQSCCFILRNVCFITKKGKNVLTVVYQAKGPSMVEKRRNVCDPGDRIAAFHNFPQDISALFRGLRARLSSCTAVGSLEVSKHLEKMEQSSLFYSLYSILAALPANPLTASFFSEDSSPRRRFERPHLLSRFAGATFAKKRPLNPFQDRQEDREERRDIMLARTLTRKSNSKCIERQRWWIWIIRTPTLRCTMLLVIHHSHNARRHEGLNGMVRR